MKLVKLSVFALAFGLFAASCNGGGEAKTENADSAAMAAPAPEATPAPAPAPADTMAAGAAKPDSSKMQAAPAEAPKH